ncbi:MAG TPA: hypothetical protein VIA62_29305 [Thermoanaerobaculia bacterium]|nr:hypothetical protein [Thermoanaerobaculia bacterium]
MRPFIVISGLPGSGKTILGRLAAVRDIQQHPEKHGLGRAWFGIVMGVLGSLALAFGIVAALMPKLMPR